MEFMSLWQNDSNMKESGVRSTINWKMGKTSSESNGRTYRTKETKETKRQESLLYSHANTGSSSSFRIYSDNKSEYNCYYFRWPDLAVGCYVSVKFSWQFLWVHLCPYSDDWRCYIRKMSFPRIQHSHTSLSKVRFDFDSSILNQHRNQLIGPPAIQKWLHIKYTCMQSTYTHTRTNKKENKSI